jgi:hypothetical protein
MLVTAAVIADLVYGGRMSRAGAPIIKLPSNPRTEGYRSRECERGVLQNARDTRPKPALSENWLILDIGRCGDVPRAMARLPGFEYDLPGSQTFRGRRYDTGWSSRGAFAQYENRSFGYDASTSLSAAKA